MDQDQPIDLQPDTKSESVPPPDRSKLINWIGDDEVHVGNARFALSVDSTAWDAIECSPDQFVLLKTRRMLDSLLKFAPEHVDNVVDLGIFRGGSVAYYHELFAPQRLVGIDLRSERVAPLDRFIEKYALSNVIRLYYGTSQDDRPRLADILRENFGDERLDLVIDDCSHMYEPTKVSLNVLLPRLRPGGVYVIEDWGWAHYPGRRPENFERRTRAFSGERTALSKLVLELVLVATSRPRLVADINIIGGAVFVTRGDEDVSEEGFNISDCHASPGRHLLYQEPPRRWSDFLTRRK
jgi:predicted O-methyltransferase YrrM